MATCNELRDRIKRRLARVSLSGLDSLIFDEMKHCQQEILEKDSLLPNFLKAQQTISQSSPTAVIDLSGVTGFIRPLNRDDTPSLQTRYRPTAATPYDEYTTVHRNDSLAVIQQKYGITFANNVNIGSHPKEYYWNGDPDGSYELYVPPVWLDGVNMTLQLLLRFYKADPTAPAAAATTLWTRHAGDYLMHTTGVEVATYLRDKDALSYFAPKREEAYGRFLKQCTAQDMGDTELVMGD